MNDLECWYCWAPAQVRDHVVPPSQGGTDDPGNLVPACVRCNQSKSSRTPEQWLEDGLVGAKRRPYAIGLVEVTQ